MSDKYDEQANVLFSDCYGSTGEAIIKHIAAALRTAATVPTGFVRDEHGELLRVCTRSEFPSYPDLDSIDTKGANQIMWLEAASAGKSGGGE